MFRSVLITALVSSLVFAGDLTVNLEFVEQTPESENLENEGTQEAIIYDTDASYLEYNVEPVNVVNLRPVKPPIPPTYTVGVETLLTSNYKVFNLPLSYRVNRKLLLKARIPYVSRTIKVEGKEYSASGLGDILVGFDLLEVSRKTFSTSTSVATDLPTGDNEKQDDGILLPLGKDAYNIQIAQFLFWQIGRLSFSSVVGFKYYFTKNEFNYRGIKYKEDVGNRYFANLGAELPIKDVLIAGSKLVFMRKEEGKLEFGGNEVDLNNGLTIVDFIFYLVPLRLQAKGFSARVSVVLPIMTETDVDEASRPVAVSIGAYKLF